MSIKDWAGAAALTLVGVMATTALAQPPEGGGRRGGGGGGFGGRMGPISVVQLAGNAAVQKDLAATEDQTTKLKSISEEAMAELRPTFGGGPGGGGTPPSDEERAAQAKKRTEIVEKYKPKIAEVLNAGQMDRLGQIAIQAAGVMAFSEPAVAKKLNITPEQREKIASINKEFDAKRRELMPARGAGGGGGGGGGGDFQAIMAKMQELNKTHEKDVTAVLTADQQTQFAELKGKEFDVAQLRGGPGGPGGGGQGGRRRPPE